MKTELTSNEKSVLKAIVANAKSVGDNDIEFILEDVSKAMNKNIRSISATAGSLAKKGMLLTANGESYFDGVVTEAGFQEVEENSENQDNMENIESVMDERIVRLNELKSVKLASLTKTKRPAAREAKTAARFVLERWDDTEELQRLVDDEEMKMAAYEVWAIADSRIKQLSYRPEEAPKVYKDVNGVEIKAGCCIKDLSADGEETEVFEDEGKLAVNADGTTVYLSEIETDKVLEVVTNKKQAPKEKKVDKSKKDVQPKEKTAKTARKVGDRHPNGLWLWTEYKPGKFDWRTDPALKHQGRTAQSEGKTEAKVGKKKPAKAEAPQPKRYNVEGWVAMTTRLSHLKRNLSKAQKDVLQYIYKGYRITADRKFWRNDKGETKACVWGAVEALLKRYNTDYMPQGLIIE